MTNPADILQRAHHEERKLWIPGKGEVDPRVNAAERVVSEYDERLVLARHEVTGDWVVFIKVDRDNIYPVIGIGPELPANAEDLRARLRATDTRIHGDKILRQINESNERIKKESRARALDADGQVAEALEWGFRREGVLSPQVFIPRDL